MAAYNENSEKDDHIYRIAKSVYFDNEAHIIGLATMTQIHRVKTTLRERRSGSTSTEMKILRKSSRGE